MMLTDIRYNSTQDIFTRGDGNSIGLELLLRKDVGAVSGGYHIHNLKPNTLLMESIREMNSLLAMIVHRLLI